MVIVNPSEFAPEEKTERNTKRGAMYETEPELRPLQTENPATRYGVWWHELAEQIPWWSERKKWNETFECRHPCSVTRSRALEARMAAVADTDGIDRRARPSFARREFIRQRRCRSSGKSTSINVWKE